MSRNGSTSVLMRRGLALLLGVGVMASATSATAQEVLGSTGIRGAGSTFAYPVLSKWSLEYRGYLSRGGAFPAANSGLEDPPATTALDYEPVGSLAGTMRVKDRSVDFGASDVPLQSEELERAGLAQFPIVIGGVVAVANLKGVKAGELRLTGPLLASIYLGEVRNWSDLAIRTLNPDLTLPDAPIVVLHRSDGSGTTFNFTHYLAKVSAPWKEQVGSDLLVKWPVGSGAKGNDGLSKAVQATPNAIAYVEYTHALKAKLSFAQVQNRAGRMTLPSRVSFQAAAASADWASARDFHLLLTDAPGDQAYPIAATVFALVPVRNARERKAAQASIEFFAWSLQHGASHAAALGYVPLPAALVSQVQGYWDTQFKRGTGA